MKREKLYMFLVVAVLLLCGCKEKVLHNLTESDANRVYSALSTAGLSGSKEIQSDGKWSISVDSKDMAAALTILSERRIVKSEEGIPNRKSSMISSRESQRFEFERNLSAEIERTLLSIEGVIEARVHLNIPPVDPILGTRSDKHIGSASVLLIGFKNFTIEQSDLASLVSGASGISSDKVSILITRTEEPVIPPLHRNKGFSGFIDQLSPSLKEIIGGVMFASLGFLGLMFGLSKFKSGDKKRFAKLNSQFESARSEATRPNQS